MYARPIDDPEMTWAFGVLIILAIGHLIFWCCKRKR